MSLPRKLKNYVLFNDGVSYVGEIDEVTLPKLTRKTEDYRSGGMTGTIELDFGMEGLKLEWTAAGYLRTLLNQWGTLTHDGVLLRFAGALQSDDLPFATPLEVVVRGRHKEIDFGSNKPGDKTAIKITSSLSYYKISMDGTTVIELDFVNMIEIVNGEDRLASVRLALGI